MSDSSSTQNQGAKRAPKVGVYVPRHRRGNDDALTQAAESCDSGRSSNASSPRPQNSTGNGSRTHRYNDNASREDAIEDSSLSGSEVQRRGRGKFMGPGGNGSGTSTGGGNSRSNRDYRGTGHAPHSNISSQPQLSSSSSPQQPAVPRPSRGRDFDATVLRRYSDDENRPNSGFSRSSSYSSLRSNNNNNGSSSPSSGQSSSNMRSSGRGYDSYDRRPDRAEEGSWRRTVPKTTEAEDQERQLEESKGCEAEESEVVSQLERMSLSAVSGDRKEDFESQDEPEEWELALEDSDEDAIPRLGSPKSPKTSTPPHPAEHLLRSGASSPKTASKVGNWSDVVNDDLYILELYNFSPTIKTVHLTDMFAPFENRSGGFRIKWVDDTKALVIFESAAVAKQAYIANLTSQIAKIKPYNGPDKESIRNAGKPSSGAYNGVRPAKTDSVARRLVQGALGLRVRRTPEQIAEEKALVQAAKEARDAQRQEQQRQRQEMDAVFNS